MKRTLTVLFLFICVYSNADVITLPDYSEGPVGTIGNWNSFDYAAWTGSETSGVVYVVTYETVYNSTGSVDTYHWQGIELEGTGNNDQTFGKRYESDQWGWDINSGRNGNFQAMALDPVTHSETALYVIKADLDTGSMTVWFNPDLDFTEQSQSNLFVSQVSQSNFITSLDTINYRTSDTTNTYTWTNSKLYTKGDSPFGTSVADEPTAGSDWIVSYTETPAGVNAVTHQGTLSVNWYADDIARVRFIPGGTFPADKTQLDATMLVDTAKVINWNLTVQDPNTLILQSNALKVVVDGATAQVSFYDLQDNKLLGERAQQNRLLEPFSVAGVSTNKGHLVFDLPDNEAVYGMGQHQDGFLDRRHVPTRLQQQNTKIGLPVVVSTGGYGLFFNHMTYMDLNTGSSSDFDSLSISNPSKVDFGPGCTASATLTPQTDGYYGFYIQGYGTGDVSKSPMKVTVDGQPILHHVNFWNEPHMGGAAYLQAGNTYSIDFEAGQANSNFKVTVPDNRFDVAIEAAEDLDYFFIKGPEIDDVIVGYRQLTGAAPMPPKYMMGFWQCREAYHNQTEILDNAQGFRDRNIPVDIIVQDWNWWTSTHNRIFNSNYPDPVSMLSQLGNLNLKVMFSCWGNGYSDQQSYWGPDYFNGGNFNVYDQVVRDAYWSEIRDNLYNIGADGWWHDGTEGYPISRSQTDLGPGYMHHNDFALNVSRATYEGQRRDANDATRPWILTRSAWGGQQRYGSVMWSGDVSSTWDHFRTQITAGLNFCMAGVPYWTTDTAGFFRGTTQVPAEDGGGYSNQYTDPRFQELLTRWIQYSTFCPVQRIHGYQSNTEIWRYEPSTYQNVLDMIKLRYRLLPYNYSVCWMVSDQDYTMMRALPMDFRADPNTHNIKDQFMSGPTLMACPVTTEGALSRDAYLPTGSDWIDFWTGDSYTGGQTISANAPIERLPLYAKAGSIVPCGPDVEYSGEKPADPLEIRVYPGTDGTFTLYEDEGENHNYESGQYSTIDFAWDDSTRKLTISSRNGSFVGMLDTRTFNIVFVRSGYGIGLLLTADPDLSVTYHGQTIVVQQPEGIVNMPEFSDLARGWQDWYDMQDLLKLAENWLAY